MRATYRLQLTPELDFAAVAELVPYLRDLGISHLYLSPSLQARHGSTHGYDVVDPTRVSDALGGEAGLRALREAGLEIVLDIVPNHMGVSDENRWWADEELRARFFDWDPKDGWYRRFFDIDDLAAVRVEDPEVFAVTHGKVLELVRDGVIAGLRIDHPDGLADPAGYLRRLADAGAEHVWVEKILHTGEALRDWPVEGTVGYEFLNDATALFVDPAGEAALTDLFAELTGETRAFAEVALEAQVQQATTTFAREVARLRSLLDEPGLADALAALPVYRTYVEPWSGRVEADDVAAVEEAEIAGRLRDALLLRERGHDEFVTRFQQTSPPVTAKGVEDTAFYRYNRLVALNEVGGDPGRFGLSVQEFHAANAVRAERFPRGLLVTQTHDTKRSGDVRARIGALAGMAAEWREQVLRWRDAQRAAAGRRRPRRQRGVPDLPDARRRLADRGRPPRGVPREGAARGQAQHELGRAGPRLGGAGAALRRRPPRPPAVPRRLRAVRGAGRRGGAPQRARPAAAQAHRRRASPTSTRATSSRPSASSTPTTAARSTGTARRAALDALRGGAAPTDETMKLFLIWKALDLRGRREAAFAGAYEPLDAGPDVCAYGRGGEVLVVVPVRPGAAAGATLRGAGGRWRDVLAGDERDVGDEAAVADLVDGFGLALLERA